MKYEIERRFLVLDDKFREFLVLDDKYREFTRVDEPPHLYVQGYLSEPGAPTSVRVRVDDTAKRGFLTIKGLKVEAKAPEYEYEVPFADAMEMLSLTGGATLRKVRRRVAFAGFVWEVDMFLERHHGLVIAEIELPYEDTPFEMPPWCGREITSDHRYSNASLAHADGLDGLEL